VAPIRSRKLTPAEEREEERLSCRLDPALRLLLLRLLLPAAEERGLPWRRRLGGGLADRGRRRRSDPLRRSGRAAEAWRVS
jgi:hypothetical protein